MLQRILFSMFTAAIAATLLTSAAGAQAQSIAVANAGSSELVEVATSGNGRVTSHTPLGVAPRFVLVTPDGKFAYVSRPGNNDVAVVDLKTNKVVANVAMSDSLTSNPQKMWMDQAGTRIKVATESKVVSINIAVDASGKHANSVAPLENVAITTNSAANAVTVAMTTTATGTPGNLMVVGAQSSATTSAAVLFYDFSKSPAFQGSITLSADPARVLFSPDGMAWVAMTSPISLPNGGFGNLFSVNPATLAVGDVLNPSFAALSDADIVDTLIYAAGAGQLFEVNTAAVPAAVTNTITFPSAGSGPTGVAATVGAVYTTDAPLNGVWVVTLGNPPKFIGLGAGTSPLSAATIPIVKGKKK